MAQRNFISRPLTVREYTVLRVEDVTPRMRRVVLGGDQLRAFEKDGMALPPFVSTGFDDHVKLIFAAEGDVRDMLPVQREASIDWTPAEHRQLRDYTPRFWDEEKGELALDFVMHGTGPAAAWARTVRPGESLFSVGPKSSLELPERIDAIILLGDETALPSIGRFLDERPTEAPATIIVEIADASAQQDLPLRAGDTIDWVAPGALVDTVIARDLPAGDVYVWAGAEASDLLPLRRWLSKEKKHPKAYVNITGYWHRTEEEVEAAEVADGGHDIDDLFSPVPWFATRAALSLGLLEAVEDAPLTLDALAASTSVAARSLRALVDLLVSYAVLAEGEEGIALGEHGVAVLADDHLRASMEDTVEAQQLAALADLVPLLRGETDHATLAGRSLAQQADEDAVAFEEHYDEAISLDFIAPSVVPHLAGAARVEVTGPGSAAIAKIVGDVAAVTIVEGAGGREVFARELPKTPSAASFTSTDLVVSALGLVHRTDDEARELLARMRGVASRGWIIEHVSPAGALDGIDAHDATHNLLHLTGTGAPARSIDDLTALATAAGWTVEKTTSIGWDHQLLHLG